MSKKIRILAVALSLSILAGMAGCTSKETTKKPTKKPAKKTTTEEEIDPPTEDPGESTSDEDPDMTTAPSDTDPSDTSDSSSNTDLVPTDTSDTDDTSGTSGSNGIDPGPNDPNLPGAPCRDSSQGKISRDLYEQFLLGNEKVDASFFGEYKDYSYMLAIPGAEVPTEKLSLDEVVHFVHMHLDSQRDDINPYVSYAFIDAGLDGDPELVCEIMGLGDFRMEMIIKCIDGELYLTAVFDAWSRNDVSIFRTGLVETDGSEGFNMTLQDRGLIDANGKYSLVAKQAFCNDAYATLEEELQELTDYTDSHPDEQGNIVVARMNIVDLEPIYTATTYTYLLGRTDDPDVSAEVHQIIDKFDTLNFVSMDTYIEILRENFPDGVLDSSMAEYSYLG
ncbi:MAG: hypothetical protein J5636_11395 [Clostridiales bacterium]|nr:hypothetical protein [Clostridiales bacterium]